MCLVEGFFGGGSVLPRSIRTAFFLNVQQKLPETFVTGALMSVTFEEVKICLFESPDKRHKCKMFKYNCGELKKE